MFALIDVNGMYASCEQAFRPDLANRAVAVLSNNDGNIVARNYREESGPENGRSVLQSQTHN